MEVECPKCNQRIAAEDVNVAKDLGFCRHCNEAFVLSYAVAVGDLDEVDFADPPKGLRIEDYGHRLTLTATTRHAIALFLVPFTCVWSGFSMVGIYGTQIWKGEFDIAQSLFGLPFLVATIFLVSACLMATVGKVRVVLDGSTVAAFTGVGGIGRRKTADWSQVTDVKLVDTGARSGNQAMVAIELDGPEPTKFGSVLSEPRRNFIAAVLRRMLRERR